MEQQLTLEYLKQLDHPEEALTENAWRELKSEIFNLANNNIEYRKIIDKRINEIATELGFLWKNQKDEKLTSLLTKSLYEIKNRKFMGDWYKKSITLMIWNLTQLKQEQFERLISEDIDNSLKIPYQTIRIARTTIHKELITIKKSITPDNIEEQYTKFLKTFIITIGNIGSFNTKNIKRYIKVFFMRFKKSKTYAEIATTLEINQGLVNSILNKFYKEFKALYVNENGEYDEEKFAYFVRKWEQLYDTIFETLNPIFGNLEEKLDERNQKLKGLLEFQNYFIGNELADYID